MQEEIPDVLVEIVARKELEVKGLYKTHKAKQYEIIADHRNLMIPSFYGNISNRGNNVPNLIAEFKLTSPSNTRKGNPDFRPGAEPEEIAKIYEECGASAMSVLTDVDFKGDIEHLKRVRDTVNMPLLRKDFIIDPAQIYEARCYGADAILLIAAILEPEQIREYIEIAKSLSMDCLVESHTLGELEKAIEGEAEIFGINNRDLRKEDFPTDLNTTLKLIDYVPEDCPIVSESGIHTYEDVQILSDPRINAILVGTTLMRSGDNLRNKIYELQGR